MTETTVVATAFATALGEALRAVRYAGGLSQRELATQLGVSKSALARLEHGDLAGPVALLTRLLQQLGFEITLADRRDLAARLPTDIRTGTGTGTGTSPGTSRGRGIDQEVTDLLTFWRSRLIDEEVRDAAGRRPPAHRHVYPLRGPHRWWHARHPHTPWRLRPLWSYSAFITWPQYAKRLGRYPPPVGDLPVGGAPMQGWPPPEALVRAGAGGWPRAG